jgi:chromosome segregation ATPase
VWRNSRRLLLPPHWAKAREMIASLIAERDALRDELAETKRTLHDVRSALRDLLAARAAREQAEASLRELYRERELERAEAAQHDPATRLH